ncbi:hypothetical protein BKA24_000807 [Microbacterium marinum]|uniref:Uncharacterized protein n=1 Tax=Microbacterium marinum TaxID=421115 RepID=A0A7W7FIH5_9MICO|nr:hypothetical protein [Microbacterium marinum]MBB4666098.1 hypothetical protein [Microbacterium marinum]
MRHGTRRHARWAAASALVAGAIVLAGCGPSPWALQSPEPTVTDPAGSAAPTDVAPPVENDLSGGSTERQVTAGAVTATIDYWSTLRMDKWTPNAVKPVSLSMITKVKPNDGQKVYLQKATMLAVPANATESFEALTPQVDESSLNGTPGYLVLSPYSYSQTFNVGQVPAEATYVTVQFTFDYLVQTTPKSKEYAKQTASDTLTIAIAQPADDGAED